MNNRDISFMKEAIKCAQKALLCGEVPIGAVIVKDGKIIAKGYNKSIKNTDTTAHAEIIAIRKACKKLNNYRLNDCTVYITIEPCAMCTGALIWARAKKIVFGAYDVKAGACGSVFNIPSERKLNHKIEVSGGLLQEECATIIKEFFKNKR
ncbi:tRNA adenosine(34) deaminase TadA [Elusimicrobiota bacterium]